MEAATTIIKAAIAAAAVATRNLPGARRRNLI
jgi:hypothetical protein